jgi:membrane protease YdiL (CAAX protease family)
VTVRPIGRGKAIGVVAAFLMSGVLLTVGLYQLAAPLIAPGPSPPYTRLIVLQSGAALAGFGVATWVFAFRVAGLDLTALRWRPGGPAGFARGFLIGAVPAGAVMVLGVLAGARWALDGEPVAAWVMAVVRLGVVLLPSALSEEIIFRGLPLVVLALAFDRATAIIVLAALFGLVHVLNPGSTALAVGNVALAGAFLGVVFYLPGGLWTATGAHLGWNLTLAALGAPVSGVPLSLPGLDHDPGPARWVTGGAFGPEGGLLATVTLAVAAVLVARHLRKESGP